MKFHVFIIAVISALFTTGVVNAQTLQYPVDVLYNENNDKYYVSNWNQEGNGSILLADEAGNITGTFYSNLKYPGGMTIVGEILYITNNYDIINYTKPSYIVGIELNTGQQVLNRLIDADQCYLDLMDTDGANLYFGNSVQDVIYKFNIQENSLTELVPANEPYGVCYDYIHGRIVYFESDFEITRIKSVKPDGTGVQTLLNDFSGYLEGIIMDHKGRFYYTSWGDDFQWGNENVYTNNSTFSDQTILSTGHDRPFGMCITPEKILYVCNWGGHSFSFLDISEYLPVNEMHSPKDDIFSLSPNPCFGFTNAILKNIQGLSGEIIVANLSGGVMFSEKINVAEKEPRISIDLSGLAKGMYFVTLFAGEYRFTEKLIIK